MTDAYAKFYSRWLKPLEFDLDESHLDCDSCRTSVGRRPETGLDTPPARIGFSSETKCCTYFPFLPNFTLGALFQSADRSLRVRLAVAIGQGRATPLGLFETQERANRVIELGDEAFGRAKELICPFFDSSVVQCSIWENRPGVCSSYYCNSAMDRTVRESGPTRIWGEIENYVNAFEWTLAHEALWRIGFTQDEVGTMEEVRKNEKMTLDKAWYEWAGREEEFYLLTYQKALEVNADEIEYMLGNEGRAMLAAAHRLAVANTSAF